MRARERVGHRLRALLQQPDELVIVGTQQIVRDEHREPSRRVIVEALAVERILAERVAQHGGLRGERGPRDERGHQRSERNSRDQAAS